MYFGVVSAIDSACSKNSTQTCVIINVKIMLKKILIFRFLLVIHNLHLTSCLYLEYFTMALLPMAKCFKK